MEEERQRWGGFEQREYPKLFDTMAPKPPGSDFVAAHRLGTKGTMWEEGKSELHGITVIRSHPDFT